MSTHVQPDNRRNRNHLYDDHLLDYIERDRRNQYIKGTAALVGVAVVVAMLVYGFMELAAVV